MPLDFFRFMPSLSTTSSAHCTDRLLAVCAPRSRSVAVGGRVCVCVWVCVTVSKVRVWLFCGCCRWASDDCIFSSRGGVGDQVVGMRDAALRRASVWIEGVNYPPM